MGLREWSAGERNKDSEYTMYIGEGVFRLIKCSGNFRLDEDLIGNI
jgi:hypothetical protein